MIYYLNLTALIKPLKLYFTMYLNRFIVLKQLNCHDIMFVFCFLSKLDEVPNICYNL